MKTSQAVLSLWLLALSAVMAAPTKGAPEGERFLFVVETSSAMEAFDHAGRQAVFDLIFSGVGGRMQPGDTLGIWTFSDEVRGGVYPMQVWTPEKKLQLASQAGKFLETQKYEHKGRLDHAVPKILSQIFGVKDLNVIIISGNEVAWKGTTFDGEINQSYRAKAPASRSAKRPLITALAGRKGDIVYWQVTLAGDDIWLPARTAPTNVAKVTPVSEAQAATTNPPAASLEQTGAVTQAAAPANARVQSPARAPVRNIIITKQTVASSAALPESPQPLLPEKRAVETNASAASITTALERATALGAATSAPPVSNLVAISPATAPATNIQPPALMTAAAQAPPAAGPVAKTTVSLTNESTLPMPTKPAPPPDSSVNESVTRAAIEPAPLSKPALQSAMPVAARELGSTNPPAAKTVLPPLALGRAPEPPPLRPLYSILLLGAASAGAVVMLVIFARSFRSRARPSFITRSFDRDKL